MKPATDEELSDMIPGYSGDLQSGGFVFYTAEPAATTEENFSGYGHAQSPFKCQFQEEGLVATPSIPDIYFNHENAANFRNMDLSPLAHGVTYIFPIPPVSAERDCYGTVVEMQFCYQYGGNNLEEISAFKFLSLTKNGTAVTVDNSITVNTSVLDNTCTDSQGRRVCCSVSTSNDFGKLEIPSTDYAFGITITSASLLPLAFSASVTDYQFDQFQASSFSSTPGDTTQLTGAPLNRSLPIFRFLIGINGDINGGNDKSEQETSTSNGVDKSNSTEINASDRNAVSNALIGGVAGGAAAAISLLLTIFGVAILLMVVRRRRSSGDTKDTSYNNAVYEMTESAREKVQPAVMSEGGPPPAYSVVDMSKKKKKKTAETVPEEFGEGTYDVVTEVDRDNIDGGQYSVVNKNTSTDGGQYSVVSKENSTDGGQYSVVTDMSIDNTTTDGAQYSVLADASKDTTNGAQYSVVSSTNEEATTEEAYNVLDHARSNGTTPTPSVNEYAQVKQERYGRLDHTAKNGAQSPTAFGSDAYAHLETGDLYTHLENAFT